MIWYFALALLVAALVFGLGMSWDKGDDRMRQLRERLQLVEAAVDREARSSLSLIRDDLMSEIPALNRWLDRMGRGTALRSWLRQADLAMRPGKFLTLCAAFALGGGAVALLFAPWYGALLAALAGAALPYAWVRRKRSQRLTAFQGQFPEAIDLLVRASRAGHPPSSALELIAGEMPNPVSGEFRQVFDQQRFGLPLRDCLLNLAERVPLVDVQFFATSMIIQRESGGNLAEILEKLSHVIRERVKIMRQVKTHTAQGRMTMYVLIGMAPIMLVAMFLLSHNFMMPMFTDPMGRGMLMAAAVLQVIGIYLLNKIVSIKV
jgi:tight adherence protein B